MQKNVDYIRLLEINFPNISFSKLKDFLPSKLQEGFYRVFKNMYNNFGNNFSNKLAMVSIQELDTEHENSFATYEYDEEKYGGGAIKINIKKYGSNVDVEITQGYFGGTVVHEIAHHLAKIHNLRERINDFYDRNLEYIRDYYTIDIEDLGHLENGDEFFAFSFCRFYYGFLDKEFNGESNKIYDFINGICEELRRKR